MAKEQENQLFVLDGKGLAIDADRWLRANTQQKEVKVKEKPGTLHSLGKEVFLGKKRDGNFYDRHAVDFTEDLGFTVILYQESYGETGIAFLPSENKGIILYRLVRDLKFGSREWKGSPKENIRHSILCPIRQGTIIMRTANPDKLLYRDFEFEVRFRGEANNFIADGSFMEVELEGAPKAFQE